MQDENFFDRLKHDAVMFTITENGFIVFMAFVLIALIGIAFILSKRIHNK